MRKRTVLFVVAGLVALVLGAKSLELFLVANQQTQEVRFPDGKRMRLLMATWGVGHAYLLPSTGFLQRVLPEWAWSYLRIPPPQTHRIEPRGITPSMALWLSFPDGADSLTHSYILTGDDGTEQLIQASRSTFFSGGVIGVEFGAFPRRANEIQLRALVQDLNGSRIATPALSFRNPARGVLSPKWPHASLPAQSHDRGTKFTLLDLVSLTVDPKSPDRDSAYFDYSVDWTGASSAEWHARPVRISDAAGNLSERFSYNISNGRVSFTNGLSVMEPWKLEIQYYKASNFSESELVEMPALTVPPIDTQTVLNQEIGSREAKAKLRAFGNRRWELGASVHTGPFQVLVFEKPSDAQVNVLKAVDDQGRSTRVNVSHDETWLLFRFELQPDVKSISLTLSLVPQYRAEFMVQPRNVPSVQN